MTTRSTLENRFRSNSGAESLTEESLRWMASHYDPEAGLLWSPQKPGKLHMVRESAWYALGLFTKSYMNGSAQNLDQAVTMIESVLENQWHAPGKIWHGTFRRAPEEADPPEDAVIWKDYDPNWRQFIGSVLLLLLRLEGEDRLKHLAGRMRAALELCIQGEPPQRVPPSYTNIALMRAWLEVEMADLMGEETRERGLIYAKKIKQLFDRENTFAEYNSPTYYGINFYALGLWQHYSSNDELRAMGEDITHKLWQDVGRYYHADMKNLCGPWSRSYGMDMQDYVAGIGLWIWAVTDKANAPFPINSLQNRDRLNHDHDFCLGPIAAISATQPPIDTLAKLRDFSDTQQFTQIISEQPRREAHVWMTSELMIGLETADISYRGTDQYHPFTVHWRVGDQTHWCRLRFRGRLEGNIQENTIDLTLVPDDGVDQCRLEFSTAGRLSNAYDVFGLALDFETTLDISAVNSELIFSNLEAKSKITLSLKLETPNNLS